MKFILYLILFIPFFMVSQSEINGIVMELNPQNKNISLSGANVFWLNTSIGTITSDDGTFRLPYESSYKKIVISYIGFKSDTLTIELSKNDLSFVKGIG